MKPLFKAIIVPPPNAPIYRVIIAGGREFNDYVSLCKYCDIILANKISEGYAIEIVSGDARGADKWGIEYAHDHGHALKIFKARWRIYGKRAGPMRNQEMADYADALIAFWNKKSPGTKNMITLAKLKGLPVREIYCKY